MVTAPLRRYHSIVCLYFCVYIYIYIYIVNVYVCLYVYVQISVTQYVSNRGKNSDETENDKTSFTYRYEMWTPQRERFETIVQTFQQFPSPELRWNLIDNIVAGNLGFDGIDQGIKTRRLKFMVIPYSVCCPADLEAYHAQFDLLLEFFRKYLAKEEKIAVAKDSALSSQDYCLLEPVHGVVSHNQLTALYKQTSRDFSVAKLMMRGPNDSHPNWIYLRYDKSLYGFKAFHFEIHWKVSWHVCSPWRPLTLSTYRSAIVGW
jgi:hypothetical protein